VQRRIYNAIVDGRLDAERVRGRWYVSEALVPVAADLLLIEPAARQRAPGAPPTNAAVAA